MLSFRFVSISFRLFVCSVRFSHSAVAEHAKAEAAEAERRQAAAKAEEEARRQAAEKAAQDAKLASAVSPRAVDAELAAETARVQAIMMNAAGRVSYHLSIFCVDDSCSQAIGEEFRIGRCRSSQDAQRGCSQAPSCRRRKKKER